MARLFAYLGQAVVYLLTAVLLGVFSDTPAYRHFPEDQALVKLSLVHSAERKEPCRRLTPEELAKLAPNMRKPMACSRERLPLWVEMSLDDELLFGQALEPGGLSKDGPARVYEKFPVAPGRYRLSLGMRDSARTEGFDYRLDTEIELRALQNLVIDFRSEGGGFILRQ
jgi:hypothetical protein